MLSADGVRPGEQKIIAVQQFPQPQNKHEVKRFLGLCCFFRRFIPHYAEIALPVSELLKEQTPYVWMDPGTRRCVSKFEEDVK